MRLVVALPGLFDRISKRFRIFTNPNVPCHDRDERRRFAKQLRRCKMHRVERANGFYWKRPADPGEHRVCHGHQI